MGGYVQLKGARELYEALSEMEPRLAKKVLRTALRNAARPILAAAKANAPYQTGATRSQLKLRAMKRKKGRVGVIVQTGEGAYKGDVFYASFAEWGTRHQPAKPFMRPAFDTNAVTSIGIASAEIRVGVEAVANGLPKYK